MQIKITKWPHLAPVSWQHSLKHLRAERRSTSEPRRIWRLYVGAPLDIHMYAYIYIYIYMDIHIWILIHLHSRHCIRQIGQRNRFLGQNLRRCKTSALFNNTVCLLNRSQNFWHRRKPSYPGLLPVLLLHFAATWWVPEWVVVVHSKES